MSAATLTAAQLPDAHGRRPLTPAQREVYDFVRDQCLDGRPPNFREIQDRFGWSSKSAAANYLRVLARKGWVVIERGRANSVRPAVPEISVRPSAGGRVVVATTGPVRLTPGDLHRLSESPRPAA